VGLLSLLLLLLQLSGFLALALLLGLSGRVTGLLLFTT
jgi:hypothetical protein